MAKKDKYLVGLDIGSTKTSVLIAEIDGELLKFLALGAAESKGLRKGLIVNLVSTVSSIRRAVEEAEGVANVPVEEALIGVAGNHVRGVNSRGGITLGTRPRDIERDDVRRAVDAARQEQRQAHGRPGILAGGSAYGCVFTGGAANNLFTSSMLKRPTGRSLRPVVSAYVVLGWVLAMVIAIHFGLGATLLFGAGAYCLAAGLSASFLAAGNH